jgi:hypothetical protein
MTVQSINPAAETLSSFVAAAIQDLESTVDEAREEAKARAVDSGSDADEMEFEKEIARNIGARFVHKFEAMV